ncbi:MAG: sel1 repeat family protein [Magnetococcales bacterium]|nr:sel1 repeat family protein [Magnetococcales bacterium]
MVWIFILKICSVWKRTSHAPWTSVWLWFLKMATRHRYLQQRAQAIILILIVLVMPVAGIDIYRGGWRVDGAILMLRERGGDEDIRTDAVCRYLVSRSCLAMPETHSRRAPRQEGTPGVGQMKRVALAIIVFMLVAGSGYPESRDVIRAAAEHGDAKAQHVLGAMYTAGKGVPQDDIEAVKWYHKAAEQGDARGQYLLALMYLQGRGVAQDRVQAYMWADIARVQGYKDAVKCRGLAAKKMNPDQVALAQELAQSWIALKRLSHEKLGGKLGESGEEPKRMREAEQTLREEMANELGKSGHQMVASDRLAQAKAFGQKARAQRTNNGSPYVVRYSYKLGVRYFPSDTGEEPPEGADGHSLPGWSR